MQRLCTEQGDTLVDDDETGNSVTGEYDTADTANSQTRTVDGSPTGSFELTETSSSDNTSDREGNTITSAYTRTAASTGSAQTSKRAPVPAA